MRRALVVVAALLGAVLLPAGPAHADAAQAQGWWWVLHRAALPAPPAPPDVGETDLLLQGGDLQRLVEPATPPAPTALGALRFVVPAGDEVGTLVLKVAAGARADDVRAYPAAGTWAPAQAGAIEDAATPDLARFAPGYLAPDGTTLSFPEAGSLTGDDGVLSLVLVAGPTDRVVVHRPDATALTLTPAAPSTTPEPVPPSQPVPEPAPGPVTAPQPVALPPVVPPAAAGPVVPPPAVVPAAPAANAPVALRREVADDSRTRVLVLLEVLLLLVFFGLLGQGPLAVLGRRLGSTAPAPTERGVGRFRRPREGRPPRL
jgi:hypothetical protein